MHTQVLVVGGGPGGYAAAFLAADLGMNVTLVEREPRLGGVCLLKGCIPSKALLHVARVISESREMQEWGVDFDIRGIDVEKMRERKVTVIKTLSDGLRQLAKRRNVTVVTGRAVFEASQRIRVEGLPDDQQEFRCITYDHCILATGSEPAMPKAFQIGSDRVMDSTGALELPDVPERLLVVGGGYIGLEMGTVYGELGSKVTVVEMLDGLLPGVDRDLVKPLQKRLSGLFENIYLKTKVASMKEVGDGVEVQFEGEAASGAEKFDRVLVAIGRRPLSGGIGLENTDVVIDEQGFVQVDEQQRTADPHILAIGDVVGQPMLAHKASHEGKVAAEVLAGQPAAFEPMAIPAVVFTDPEIAWAGLTESQAKAEGRQVKTAIYPWGASGRAQAVGRTDGLTKLVVDPDNDRVLGIGICGVGAGELIAEGVLAIEMGCTTRDLAESIHPHPTLSETVAFAGEAYLGTATEIYKPKRK